MEIKTLSRGDWPRILERDQAFMPLNCEGLNGWAGLLAMFRVTAPLAVPVLGEMLTIADDGYTWLQIALEGEHWWLTVMFDRDEKIIQYYFDISLKNEIDGERSWFMDLYLDVALLPDGRFELLDRDELDAALAEGTISAQEHALAVSAADALIESIPEKREQLESFCRGMYRELVAKIMNEAKY